VSAELTVPTDAKQETKESEFPMTLLKKMLVLLCVLYAVFACAAPVHDAAAKGGTAKLEKLIKADHAVVNARDKDGARPLHRATAGGHLDTARFLIESKANVNAKKSDGVTPLHIAASLGKKQLAELLISKGAKVNSKDARGRTPLSLAQEKGWKEAAEFLAGRDAAEPWEPSAAPAASKNNGDDPYVPWPAGTVKVALDDEPFTVFRETPAGRERQVSLHFLNDGDAIPAGHERVITDNRTLHCHLEPIPQGESHDVIWVPADASTVRILLTKDDKTLLNRQMPLPKFPPEKVITIPQSPIIKTVPPLCIRGTNYLPRDHPWPGLHRDATVEIFGADFSMMRQSLSMNTIRTFTFFDPDLPSGQFGLYWKDGCARTKAQKKLNDLLTVADRHRIKVILNPGGSADDLTLSRRMLKSILGPFADDGRILMIDVINEPGGGGGPKCDPRASAYLTQMYPLIRKLMPNHLLTVGLTWQFDQLHDLGIYPDVEQYHEYSGAVGRQPAGQPHVRNILEGIQEIRKIIGSKPLLIGEFGQSTAGSANGGATEERQREIYQGVFEGAEDQRILGVINWLLFDFGPSWMGAKEEVYGIVRTDGSLKPAGKLLKSTYADWARKYHAPWDTPQH
jgi:hypothetical protein